MPTTKPKAEIVHTETDATREGYEIYLELGRDRSLTKVHARMRQKYGEEAPSIYTIEHWSQHFGWQGRIAAVEAAAIDRAEREWAAIKAAEVVERARARVAFARIRASMVYNALVDRATEKPRDLALMDPNMIRAMSQFLKDAEMAERLDLGQATNRQEVAGTRGGDPIPVAGAFAHVEVLGPEGLDEARQQLQAIVDTFKTDQVMLPDGAVVDVLE